MNRACKLIRRRSTGFWYKLKMRRKTTRRWNRCWRRVNKKFLKLVCHVCEKYAVTWAAALARVALGAYISLFLPTTRKTSKVRQEYKRLPLHVSATTGFHQKVYLILTLNLLDLTTHSCINPCHSSGS
jgi:hypothetical protein